MSIFIKSNYMHPLPQPQTLLLVCTCASMHMYTGDVVCMGSASTHNIILILVHDMVTLPPTIANTFCTHANSSVYVIVD